MKEIILIDKPKGKTSFKVVAAVRKKYGIKKVGHAGTLDPRASGLLVIGVGDTGTKKLTQLIKLPKTYEATVRVGVQTTTGDLDGDVIRRLPPKGVDVAKVEKALASMVGSIHLPVPKYSAVKQGGEALYRRVRRGEKVDPPIREMVIRSVRYVGMKVCPEYIDIDAVFDVGSGTYIRALAEELGKRLGQYPATLAELRRTKIGDFKIEDVQPLESL